MLHVALAVTTALVAVAFSLSTFDRWLRSRRPYELAWTFAFAFFAVAAAALAAGAQAGWSGAAFRLFFLLGAIAGVPLLALGQMLVLRRDKRNRTLVMAVAVFVVFAAGVMAATPLTGTLPDSGIPQGSSVLGPMPRALAAVGSGGGALVVLTGTLYSAATRRTGMAMAGNLLLALGVLVSSASGLLNSVLGEMTAFAVTMVTGMAFLFMGFLLLTSRGKRPGNAHVS